MQVETLPQSMVEIKTIVLKPRLDCGDVRYLGDEVKSQLFSKFGFKPKPEDTKLLASEQYFEPYFIIGGKYVLDYCKKHVIEADVDRKTTRLFVAGQEFNSKESDPKTRRRVVKMTGEEHVHHEKQGYFILDRMNRETSPEKLPLAPFVVLEKDSELSYLFKRMNISDEAQIGYLKAKIAQRPTDVAEIMKEIFDITDRTVVYYPMYLLTFENVKRRKEASITVDGITGEILPNGMKNLATSTISAYREAIEFQSAKPNVRGGAQNRPQPEAIPNVSSSVAEEKAELFQKSQAVESQPSPPVCEEDQTEAVPKPASTIFKDKDHTTLKEEEVAVNQIARSNVCDEARGEPIPEVVPPAVKNGIEIPEQPDDTVPSKPTRQIFSEQVQTEPLPDLVPPDHIEDTIENSKHDKIDDQIQSEKTNALENQPEPIFILPPGATDNVLSVPAEEEKPIPQVPLDEERTILGFPARIVGEVAQIDDNGATVDGDVEIPSGTNVYKDLVVKGSLKIGDNCRGYGKLKASKNITIGSDTIIDGDIISGGNIFLGSRSLITGSVEAAGTFEIEENATIQTVCPRAPLSQ